MEKPRRHYSPEQKVAILREHLIEQVPVSELCEKHQIHPTLFYHRLHIDTTLCRMVALGELTSSHNAIPRSNYLFGPSWPHVRRTLLVAMEQDGDPYAVMVPTMEGANSNSYANWKVLTRAIFLPDSKLAADTVCRHQRSHLPATTPLRYAEMLPPLSFTT